MAARGPSINLNDFSGGLNTFDPEYISPLNQSPDLDNLVILDKGFTKRNGDVAWNSSVMGTSSTPIQGMGYIKFDSGTEFLNAVAGSKFYTDINLVGTMADATGALTITSGQNNIWTPVSFNNLQIWFGGAPDAPFKYSGTGNAAVLTGSPPSAATVFGANNRIFAISTTANPSRIFWPVLSNPEDWTSAGSGNADVSLSDGEALQCGVVVGPDTAILFKNNSTHMMVLTRQPFPIYQLQRGTGIAGRYAFALANGTIYFVTPGLRMKSTTDGFNFKTYPNDVNDLWDSINPQRIPYIQAIYYQALDWIVFNVSTGSSTTNNYAIIWDIRHQCFLRCTTGFKANVLTTVQNRRLFGGHYNGKMFEKLKSTIFTDDSEPSPGAIDAYWRTPFNGLSTDVDVTVHPLYVDAVVLTETSSTLDISYGFDFTSPSTTETFSLQAVGSKWDIAQWDAAVWGGQNATVLTKFVYGRGNLFSYKMRNATASQGFTVQGTTVRLRTDKARKLFNVI
jgi:hypothetical protein